MPAYEWEHLTRYLTHLNILGEDGDKYRLRGSRQNAITESS